MGTLAFKFYALGRLRGVSQYGDLHEGQTFGFFVASRGGHSCPQRSQTKNVLCTVPMGAWYTSKGYITSIYPKGIDRKVYPIVYS